MEVQHHHGALVGRQSGECPLDAIALGDVGARIGFAHRRRVGCDLALKHPASLVALEDGEAAAHGQSMKPGVEGVRLTQRTESLPGGDKSILDRVLGAIAVAQDHRSHGVLARGRRVDDHVERIPISPHRSFHQLALHVLSR